MKRKTLINGGAEIATIVLAGLIYAVALKYFVLPSRVILTGTEGIASALSYYFESYTLFIVLYVVFQIVLLIFAFMKVGRRFAVNSSLIIAVVVAALLFLPELQFAKPEPENERIILVVFGGLLAGAAKALAFRNRGSTGDEDILGAYFAMKYLKPVGSIALWSAVVSTAFGLVLTFIKNGNFESVINTLMYTCIYIFVSAETLNNYYRKFKMALVAVVTQEPKIIGNAISAAAPHRTFTMQRGVGRQSRSAYCMVRTLITQEELPEIVEAIERADPESFYYHHEVDGVSSKYYIQPLG